MTDETKPERQGALDQLEAERAEAERAERAEAKRAVHPGGGRRREIKLARPRQPTGGAALETRQAPSAGGSIDALAQRPDAMPKTMTQEAIPKEAPTGAPRQFPPFRRSNK